MSKQEKSLEELFEEQAVTQEVTDEELAAVQGGAELTRALTINPEILTVQLDRSSLVERIESIDLSRFFDGGLRGGSSWVFRGGERDVGH